MAASATAATIRPSAAPSSQETGAPVISALLPNPMHGTTSVVSKATESNT